MLNPLGIGVVNGDNRDEFYDDATVSFSATYEYRVVFVEGVTAPNATTPPTDYSASVSVSTAPDVEVIPSPVSPIATFNQRTEKSGANAQVIVNWNYRNPHDKKGGFYVYRRETSPALGNWSRLNSTGMSVAFEAEVLSMAYADNGISPNKTYEYRIVFVEGATPPFATTPPDINGINISVDTQIPGSELSSNAYVPYNTTSNTYVVDGVTYKDIYSTGQRDLRNKDHAVFRHLLNGYQLSDGETHLSRWMDIGKLIAPLDADVTGLFSAARGILNNRRGSVPIATTAMSAGALNGVENIARAASAMLAEFNGRNGYAIGSGYVPVGEVPPALSELVNAKTPVFWVLDRHFVHANNAGDDRNAGNADYAYYGTGLIFHDLKLSYLETGDPLHSAVSGITGIIDQPVSGFRYDFSAIEDPVVSGVRNLSGVSGSFTQTWTDKSEFKIGKEISILNGYEMSEMRGASTTLGVSFQTGSSSSNTIGGEVGATLKIVPEVLEVGGKGTYTYTWGTSESTTLEDVRTTSYEFNTSDIFQYSESHILDSTFSKENEFSVGVTLPPHTQVMLRQGQASITAHIDYDYPAVLSYKVTVVALGSQRVGGEAVSYMRPIATYGIDKTSSNRVSPLEIDAAENLRVQWGFRNDPGNKEFYSADTISLSRIWTQMKQADGTGAVSNFTLMDFEDDAEAALEARFITPITIGMTAEKPMTVVRSTMSHEYKSMNSEIFEFQPIYALDKIEAIGLDSISLIKGGSYIVDQIELVGRNTESVDYYGFHKDKGIWVLTDADGSPHDGSIATIVSAAGTGRPTVVADNNATGTVFLRYLIHNDVYSYDGLNGYMTPDDLGMRTAIIPVHIRSRALDITGWTYGDEPNLPVSSGGAGAASYEYKVSGLGDEAYSAAVPVNAGSYTVRAKFAGSGNDWTYSDTANFVIAARPLAITGVTAKDRPFNGTTLVELIGGSLEGVVIGDAVTFTLGDGTVATADAGGDKPVTTSIVLTGANAGNYTLVQPSGITVNIGTSAVLVSDRAVPVTSSEEAVVVAPASASAGGFTAGPNIVSKSGGVVKIYRAGALIGRPRSAGDNVLTVYDASGNVVKKLPILDNAALSSPSPANSRREVGKWDLRDAKGRAVSEGTYLLRGTIIAADGKRERVSLKVSVR